MNSRECLGWATGSSDPAGRRAGWRYRLRSRTPKALCSEKLPWFLIPQEEGHGGDGEGAAETIRTEVRAASRSVSEPSSRANSIKGAPVVIAIFVKNGGRTVPGFQFRMGWKTKGGDELPG